MTDESEKKYTEAEVIDAVKKLNVEKQQEVDDIKAALKTAHEEIESLSSQLHDALALRVEYQTQLEAARGQLDSIRDSFIQFHNLVGTPIKKA